MFQLGSGAMSLCAGMLCGIEQRIQRRFDPPRNSSREDMGNGLGDSYTSLSQALAASNSLFKTPELLGHQRSQAMRFNVSDDWLTAEYLTLFLHQTLHLDEDLLNLIIHMGQLANLAVRQQVSTSATLNSI